MEEDENWDPIEDIKRAMKSLEERGYFGPNDGKFKISKELYNYLMGEEDAES